MKEVEIKRINEELINLNKKLKGSREDYMKSVKSIKQIKEEIWEKKEKLKSLTSRKSSDSNQVISNKDLITKNIEKIEKGEELTASIPQLNELSILEYGIGISDLIKIRKEKRVEEKLKKDKIEEDKINFEKLNKKEIKNKSFSKVRKSNVLGDLDLSWIKI